MPSARAVLAQVLQQQRPDAGVLVLVVDQQGDFGLRGAHPLVAGQRDDLVVDDGDQCPPAVAGLSHQVLDEPMTCGAAHREEPQVDRAVRRALDQRVQGSLVRRPHRPDPDHAAIRAHGIDVLLQPHASTVRGPGLRHHGPKVPTRSHPLRTGRDLVPAQ